MSIPSSSTERKIVRFDSWLAESNGIFLILPRMMEKTIAIKLILKHLGNEAVILGDRPILAYHLGREVMRYNNFTSSSCSARIAVVSCARKFSNMLDRQVVPKGVKFIVPITWGQSMDSINNIESKIGNMRYLHLNIRDNIPLFESIDRSLVDDGCFSFKLMCANAKPLYRGYLEQKGSVGTIENIHKCPKLYSLLKYVISSDSRQIIVTSSETCWVVSGLLTQLKISHTLVSQRMDKHTKWKQLIHFGENLSNILVTDCKPPKGLRFFDVCNIHVFDTFDTKLVLKWICATYKFEAFRKAKSLTVHYFLETESGDFIRGDVKEFQRHQIELDAVEKNYQVLLSRSSSLDLAPVGMVVSK